MNSYTKLWAVTTTGRQARLLPHFDDYVEVCAEPFTIKAMPDGVGARFVWWRSL